MENRSDKINLKTDGRKSLVTGLRLIMSFIAVAMAVSFFVAVTFIVREERVKTVTNENERTLTALEDGVLGEIEKYKELSRLIMMDETLIGYLRVDAARIDGGLRKDTRYSVLNILNVTTMVDSVIAFRNDGLFINTSRDIYDIDEIRMSQPEWLAEIAERRGATVVSVNGNGAIVKRNGTPLVSIGRTIYDLSSQQKIGTLFMNISPVCFDRKVDVLGGKNILVASEDGTVISGDPALLEYFDPAECTGDISAKKVRDGVSNLIVSVCRIPDTPIVIACRADMGTGFVMFETVRVITILILIFVVLIVLAGIYLTKNVINPVSDLTHALEKNREQGKLEKIELTMPVNEIGVLKDSYNGMVERVNDLFSKVLDNEKIIRRAEMRVLHEQIKPHFLYNSLETIGFLAMEAGADNVHSALETLGSFYRNFLSKGDREIPLEREINIVKDYLSLQKLRYGNVIRDEYDIEEDTKSFIIPKLILQPLVENSIYHGIRLTGEPGNILIKSRLRDGELHLYVRDTGVGMTSEQIAYLLSEHEKENLSEPSESFGLWGTIERVRYFCGSDDVVRIRSELGEYTEIEFIIPRRD
ncbi:MAG: histidine kinase [Lachnospiraceae bacterium]|nr:histidine kinase [Lachnospiraceae bacterium]